MNTRSDFQVPPADGPAAAAELKVSQPATVVIFGATGDLTARKLMPALYNLHLQDYLPEKLSIVGAARRPLSDDDFRRAMREAVEQHSRTRPVNDADWSALAEHLRYQQVVFDDAAGYRRLAERLDELEADRGAPGLRLFYLAVTPDFMLTITRMLAQAGLTCDTRPECASRVVIEKPFGYDSASAAELIQGVRRVLDEEQVYRIDHYLGKETVQNILTFRFGNAIFEPLFRAQYVDHVQISVAESIGMEGRRGAYYDTAGALRDVIQNHGLQLLCLVAMEPPTVFGPKAIRDEKVKVLQSLKRLTPEAVRTDVTRGQYTAGSVNGEPVSDYRREQGVDPESQTETYVAMRVGIDNWRWAGVPFLLRTGKCLSRRVTEIAVQFKDPPLQMFTNVECQGDVCHIAPPRPNTLVFRIQPDEGINLSFVAKRPGMLVQTYPVQMDFVYDQAFAISLPEAYERLLLDALRGDASLFTRSDEVELAWGLVDPILEAWAGRDPPPLHPYKAGTWGPAEADGLFHGCRGAWRNP